MTKADKAHPQSVFKVVHLAVEGSFLGAEWLQCFNVWHVLMVAYISGAEMGYKSIYLLFLV